METGVVVEVDEVTGVSLTISAVVVAGATPLVVELAGTLSREPGPEFAGVSVVGKIAAPFNCNEFSIISSVVRRLTNGNVCKS